MASVNILRNGLRLSTPNGPTLTTFKMKISFIVPPCLDHKQPAERSAGCTRVVYLAPNLYELYAAAAVERDVADAKVEYHDFVYKSANLEQFESFIGADNSDVYVIWTVNLSIDNDLKIIDSINRLRKGVRIVLLGPGPTYFIKKCLVANNVVIVRGEPEATLVELLNCFTLGKDWKEIKGISFLNNGAVKNNPSRPLIKDVDTLPFPARHLIENQEYHNPKLKTTPYTTLLTSRNCPFKCIYCVPSSLTFAREIEYKRENGNHKPPIGFRSVENVAAELQLLADKGVKAIGFMDDNFIWNETRTAQLCAEIKKHGFVWGCQARVDAITEPIAKMLGESGCKYVDLGIESFNDDILNYIKKGITSADIYRAIGLLKKYNVPVKLNVLIGSSPLETKETVRHTLREAKKLDVDQVMFNIVSPFPGTEFYNLCKENGWLATPDYVPTDVQRESILNLPHLSSEEMERLLFKNNLEYFISFKFIRKQIRRFRSFNEFAHALKALKIKLLG